MESRRTTRRRLLAGTGSVFGLAALAGCTNIGPGGAPNETGTGETGETGETTTPETSSPDAAGSDGTTPTESGGTTADGSDRRETVTFRSTAGTDVTGTLYGPPEGRCGIVLVPQINLDRGSWEPQADHVARLGHVALAIDEDPDNRAESALGALRYLRREVGIEQVVLVGASSGGEAVIRANARAKPGTVGGLVTLSAGGGADVAGDLQGRKFFVVSEHDDDRFVRVTRRLHENAPEPETMKIYGGSAHGQGLFETDHADDLSGRIFDLIEEVCPQ